MISSGQEIDLCQLSAPSDRRRGVQPAAAGSYPAVLLVTGVDGEFAWIRDVLDGGGAPIECLVEVASTSTAALGLLHVQPFHTLVVRHAPPAADALDLLDALQLAGVHQPVVVLADDASREFLNRCYELGAESVLFLDRLTPEVLLTLVKRAIDRFELVRENDRLACQEHRQLTKERDEADHLLRQQRLMIRDLEAVAGGAGDAPRTSWDPSADSLELPLDGDTSMPEQEARSPDSRVADLPDNLVEHYRELLRTYVIMGSGNLAGEIGQLSKLLAVSGTSPRAVMSLHLDAVEQIVRGLGRRSSRHVMNRAHLLALEVMVHLAQCYQMAWEVASSNEHKP